MGKTVWSTQAQAAATSAFEDLYLTGVFGFDLSYGTGMMGSMFSDPGFYPIDVLEFTPGDKVKQTYTIGGGFAWKNGSRWTPGATASFQGVNYAKRKDLRHTTYRQEFEIAPSVHYRGDAFEAGLTGIFRKSRWARPRPIPTWPSLTRACATAPCRSGTAAASTSMNPA